MPTLLSAAVVALAILPGFAQEPESRPPAEPAIPADTEVVTTPSGLKYSILAPGGKDPAPTFGDLVRVHYTGWLEDGRMFDSSRKRGQPAEFRLGRVIAGWNEGLALVTPGAKIKLTIPPNLGYGPKGRPPVIPGGATLIFEVELLAVEPGPALPAFREAVKDRQVTTESGLVYEMLAAGEGDCPTAADTVELYYAVWSAAGRLIDCAELAGRQLTGEAGTLPLAFMKEMVLLMKPGSRCRVEVPPELAFGDQDRGADLPPRSRTVWELELHVRKKLPAPAFRPTGGWKVTRTTSGLGYEIVNPGEGPSPRPTDRVTVHYAGWLTDGTPFDASFQRGEPAIFGLNQVIAGWTEGLQLLRKGGAAWFEIPGALAYGSRGRPPKIGPDATLIFYVELIDIATQ